MLGNVISMIAFSFTLNPSSLATQTGEEKTVTVPGLKSGDLIVVNKPTYEAGIIIGNCFCGADNTLSVQIGNFSNGTVNEASETWHGIAFRVSGLQVSTAMQP